MNEAPTRKSNMKKVEPINSVVGLEHSEKCSQPV